MSDISPSGLPFPKCPFFTKCKKKIDKEHFIKFCASTINNTVFFGYTSCEEYPKNKRQKPREWAKHSKRRNEDDRKTETAILQESVEH